MKGHGKFRAVQLDNNFGIKDQAIINEAETLFTTAAALQGIPSGDFGVEHFKAIHKHVLGDLYPWAGEFRTNNLSVGNEYAQTSCPPQLINMETERVLKALQQENAADMNAIEFADKMAMYYTKLYKVSPFPDGNARAARFLIDAYSDKHQMQVSWEKVPSEAWHSAVQQSLQGNAGSLRSLFRAITDYQDLYEKHAIDAIHNKTTAIAKAVGLRDSYLPSQAITTEGDLAKLAGFVKQRLAEDLQKLASGGETMRDWNRTSITHEINNTLDRGSMGQKAIANALEALGAGAPTPPKIKHPGMG